MNNIGMDYNTERRKMRMPEYGRNIHQMVEHCVLIKDRAERQMCAESIVTTMEKMNPEVRQQADYQQKLWEHLAIMSNFELDVDYPYPITNAEEMSRRPDRLTYTSHRIPVRHYGNLVFQTLDHLKTMEPGAEREELTRLVANQMKRDLVTYGSSAPDNERIISDIAHFTDGVIQIDPEHFKFEFLVFDTKSADKNKKKKKK